jgi:hypothetical protein
MIVAVISEPSLSSSYNARLAPIVSLVRITLLSAEVGAISAPKIQIGHA